MNNEVNKNANNIEFIKSEKDYENKYFIEDFKNISNWNIPNIQYMPKINRDGIRGCDDLIIWNKFNVKKHCKISFSIKSNEISNFSFGFCKIINSTLCFPISFKNKNNTILIKSDLMNYSKFHDLTSVNIKPSTELEFTLEIHENSCYLYYLDNDNEISFININVKDLKDSNFFIKGNSNIILNNISYYLIDKNGINLKDFILTSKTSWGNNAQKKWNTEDFHSQNHKIKINNEILEQNCSFEDFVIFNQKFQDNSIIEFNIKFSTKNGKGFCLFPKNNITVQDSTREFEFCCYATGKTKYWNWNPLLNKEIFANISPNEWMNIKLFIFNGYISLKINNKIYKNIGTCYNEFYFGLRGWGKGKIYLKNLFLYKYSINNKEITNFIHNQVKTIFEQKKEIENLQNKIVLKDKKINSIPKLVNYNLGVTTTDKKITFRNWAGINTNGIDVFADNLWFSRYLKHHFPNEDYKLNFFSIFNNHYNIKKELDGKKVFYSGEDMNKRFKNFNKNFGRYALDYVDFAMGYDLKSSYEYENITSHKYLRFPYWLLTTFSPEFSEEDIINKINDLRTRNYYKTENCALISSHDWGKTRRLITNDIESITKIDYAGKWRNNTTKLWTEYNDDKISFLKQYKYIICPENIVDEGYVTEKLFDAVKADCIPLYAGGGQYLEPKVLNNKAILQWDFDKDNSDSLELFTNLLTDKKTYDEFKDQNILLEKSYKFVVKKFNELEKHMERLIYDN